MTNSTAADSDIASETNTRCLHLHKKSSIHYPLQVCVVCHALPPLAISHVVCSSSQNRSWFIVCFTRWSLTVDFVIFQTTVVWLTGLKLLGEDLGHFLWISVTWTCFQGSDRLIDSLSSLSIQVETIWVFNMHNSLQYYV